MGQATEEQIIEEARIRRHATGIGPGANLGAKPLAHFIIEVVRENWTPPEPVNPDILAFREWAKRSNFKHISGRDVDAGKFDDVLDAHAFLAGARMAREQAKPLAQYLQDRADRDDAEADRILAKYRGEA